MYKPIRLISETIDLHVIGLHRIFFIFSAVLVIVSVGLFFTRGLNLGIDFLGGTVIEVETRVDTNLATLRSLVSGNEVGEFALQRFGDENIYLLRLQDQGDEASNLRIIGMVKESLSGVVIEYRRTESVGPVVGGELQEAAMWAVGLAILAMLIYIWFRFEWQFGIAALLALMHDVFSTIGLFSLLSLEFNLATVAAILTIAGYSINDTVVIFDRCRENLVKYRKKDLGDLLSMTANQTFSRTFMTSLTTLVAILGLAIFGGAIIRDFAIAMAWGVVIGTYSSIGLALPLLMYMGLSREDDGDGSGD